MKMDIEIQGVEELRRILSVAGAQAPRALAGPLYRFAHQQILLPAKRLVPVVTSALKNSITTDGPTIKGTVVEVTVGAGGQAAPYALAVHENPRAGKTGGLSPGGKKYAQWSRVGQWKYLETPAKEAAARPGPLIEDVRREVERLFGHR